MGLPPVECEECFVYNTRTGNQTALGKFKLENKTRPVQPKLPNWQFGLAVRPREAQSLGQFGLDPLRT